MTLERYNHIVSLLKGQIKSGEVSGYKRRSDNEWKKKFIFHNEVLLQISNHKTLDEVLYLPIILKGEVFNIIKQLHSKDCAYAGVNKTIEYIKEQVYGIPSKAIKEYCKLCIPYNLRALQHETAPLKPIISEKENERWQIDLIDMRHKPDNSYCQILYYKDHFNKLSLLKALKKEEAI